MNELTVPDTTDPEPTDPDTTDPDTTVPAIADAGPDQTVSLGADVTLVGSVPSTPAFDYRWTQTSGTDVTLTGATTLTPSFTAPTTAGVLVFQLLVTEARLPSESQPLVTDTDSVIITVNAVPSFGSEMVDAQTYTVGSAITDLTLPAATGGNGTLTYSLTDLPAGLTFDAATRTITGTPSVPATTATYTLTATDADSNTDASDADTLTFSITVADPDQEDPDKAGRSALITDLAGVQSELVISTVQHHLKALDGGNRLIGLTPQTGALSYSGGRFGSGTFGSGTFGSGAGDPAAGTTGFRDARALFSQVEFHVSLNSLMASASKIDGGDQIPGGSMLHARLSAPGTVTVWGGGGETRMDNDYNSGRGDTRYDGTVWAYNAGLDYRASEALTVGAAIGYSDSDLDTTYNGGTFSETMLSLTPYLLYETPSGLDISLVGGYGAGEVDLTGTESTPFTASTDSSLLYGAARVSGTMRLLENQALEVTPNVSLLGSRKTLEGYTDTANRTIGETEATVLRLTPGLEVGYRFDFTGGTVTPFASGGFIFDLMDVVNDDDSAWSLGGGVRLATDAGLSASLEGSRELGRDNVEHQRLVGALTYGFSLGADGQMGTLTPQIGLNHKAEGGLSQTYGLTYASQDGAHRLNLDHARAEDTTARYGLGYQYSPEIMPGLDLNATVSSLHVDKGAFEGLLQISSRF